MRPMTPHMGSSIPMSADCDQQRALAVGSALVRSGDSVWTAELVASAVVPLLVARLNLLAAGYALTAGLRDRRKLAFAAGPAGVGLWALAWFISVFNPESIRDMRMVGTVGGLIAMSGFAI